MDAVLAVGNRVVPRDCCGLGKGAPKKLGSRFGTFLEDDAFPELVVVVGLVAVSCIDRRALLAEDMVAAVVVCVADRVESPFGIISELVLVPPASTSGVDVALLLAACEIKGCGVLSLERTRRRMGLFGLLADVVRPPPGRSLGLLGVAALLGGVFGVELRL